MKAEIIRPQRPFCGLSVNLEQTVLFVNHMIETKLEDSPYAQ
jgi:hypothetical protein